MPTAKIAQTPHGSSLVDILVSMGVLDESRAKQVKTAEVQYGSTQEEILTKQNLVKIPVQLYI